ncbi:MAG: metallophosphoesterase [Clostridia bacterium]|nr:metallophosphoesterase [Clostridia bacterium]
MRFLAVTDLHYTNLHDGADNRQHDLSLEKLRQAVASGAPGCDCIVNLGDTAEGFDGLRPQAELLDEVCDVLRGSGLPHYSIIGNHDTHMEKTSFYPHLDMSDRYYAFDCSGYRCLVLDACLNNDEDPLPQQEIAWDNCRIDPGQIAWLQRELDAADGKVLIFTHVPFMLEEYATENPHLIRNRDEITRIFERSGKVQAVFSGHYHDGCFGVHNGIPYITFSAMVIGEENAYAVVDVTDAGVRVTGFGRQKSAQWKISDSVMGVQQTN